MGLSVGLAVGQSSIADEISELIKRPKLRAGICYDPEDFSQELQSAVDILVATPGRLMDHINNTKGFTLKRLCYLVSCRWVTSTVLSLSPPPPPLVFMSFNSL